MTDRHEMSYEKALDVAQFTAEQRERWGKHWDGGEIGIANILDALVVLFEAGQLASAEEDKAHKAEILNLKRQLTAAKAREAKYKKWAEEAKAGARGDA